MKNTSTEILDQVMNRWVAKFRAVQATKVLNEKNIEASGIFDLRMDEVLVLSQPESVTEDVFA